MSERRVYHPVAFGEVYPARIAVRIRAGDPAAFADTLRQIGAVVNLDLQERDLTTTEILVKREQGLFRLIGTTVGLVMLSIIALSAAGIYSLMSFTVARRRREIGILGAIGLEQLAEGDMLQSRGAILLPLVVLVMTAVGVLAALGPARQGLSIQPTEALRED